MSEQRYAVLIASSKFLDEEKSSLPPLRCPEADVEGLNAVLSDENIGAFNTVLLKNEPHHEVMASLSQVLRRAKKEDLVLIYYSGHGLQDESGNLYLATTDTKREILEATSLPMASIKQIIDNSPPTKTILILDCCYSGAASGAYFKGAVKEQITQMFSEARGTCVLTASTDREVAREDTGQMYSAFTQHVITGLGSGEADINNSGHVTVDDLYTYVRDRISSNQNPTKFGNVTGTLVLTENPKWRPPDQSARIEKLLFDLGKSKTLPASIVSDALRINSLPQAELSEKQHGFYSLLEDLLNDIKKPGDFVAEWVRIELAERDLDPKSSTPQRAGRLSARKMIGQHVADLAISAQPVELFSLEWKRARMVNWYTGDTVMRHVIRSVLQWAVGAERQEQIDSSATYYDYTE